MIKDNSYPRHHFTEILFLLVFEFFNFFLMVDFDPLCNVFIAEPFNVCNRAIIPLSMDV
jgi:hypothetical protein